MPNSLNIQIHINNVENPTQLQLAAYNRAWTKIFALLEKQKSKSESHPSNAKLKKNAACLQQSGGGLNDGTIIA